MELDTCTIIIRYIEKFLSPNCPLSLKYTSLIMKLNIIKLKSSSSKFIINSVLDLNETPAVESPESLLNEVLRFVSIPLSRFTFGVEDNTLFLSKVC